MADASYTRIAAEIRRRIASGELAAGERVPSTRRIVAEWGVAMATASKVLAALRQEGLVHAVPGVGTVVSAAPREHALSRDRIVAAAIGIADAEGLDALSMRRIGAQLGVGAMSLYRYVSGRDELTALMLDAVFAERPAPEAVSDDWRAELERMARTQWAIYREHPWAARVVSFTRPVLVRQAMAHTEWGMQALAGLGLDIRTTIWIVGALSAFVCGMGLSHAAEVEETENTGVTSAEWMAARDAELAGILASGRFPQLARLDASGDEGMGLDVWFEFGLQRHLDGLADYVSRSGPR